MGINLRALAGAEPACVYKADARTRVWRVDAPQGAYVVKRFEYWPLRQWAGLCCGLHPGQYEKRRLRLLVRAGVPAAPILASGLVAGRYHLVLPYIGPSLQQLIAEGRSDTRTMDAVAGLVHKMLSAGLFNPDFKAGNILIDRDGRARLIDAGKVRRSRSVRNRYRMLAMLFHTLAGHGVDPDQRGAWLARIERDCRDLLPAGSLAEGVAAIGLE